MAGAAAGGRYLPGDPGAVVGGGGDTDAAADGREPVGNALQAGADRRGGRVEALITREWAILAGENDYTTDTFQQITAPRSPRPVAEFLREYRAEFI